LSILRFADYYYVGSSKVSYISGKVNGVGFTRKSARAAHRRMTRARARAALGV